MRSNASRTTTLFAAFLLLAFPAFGEPAEYPQVRKGLCGPAEVVHSYLEESGFFEVESLSVLDTDGIFLIYLPVPERVDALKQEERLHFGLEKIVVLHTDWSPEHRKNWRCITDVSFIGDTRREALTVYFNTVDDALK